MKNTRAERIKTALEKALNPSLIELRDDSSKHAGHAGAAPEGETHFHLIISAEGFKGLSRVQRHQRIYTLLQEEMQSGLHALSIEVKE